MADFNRGVHGEYRWAEFYNPAVQLYCFVSGCPGLVLWKTLVVTSCDSGPLELDPYDSEEGWRQSEDLAILESVRGLEGLPFVGHDEWYVFAAPPSPRPMEVFINFGAFRFSESTADDCEALPGLQRRFWAQFLELGAESYLAEGNIILFATRNPALFEKAIEVLERLSDRKE